jgi:hypothetical protein
MKACKDTLCRRDMYVSDNRALEQSVQIRTVAFSCPELRRFPRQISASNESNVLAGRDFSIDFELVTKRIQIWRQETWMLSSFETSRELAPHRLQAPPSRLSSLNENPPPNIFHTVAIRACGFAVFNPSKSLDLEMNHPPIVCMHQTALIIL